MEFIVRQWEEFDQRRQQEEATEKADREFYQEEILRLREMLRVSEEEREEVMGDVREMERELRKVTIGGGSYTFGDSPQCSPKEANMLMSHPAVVKVMRDCEREK